MRNMGKSVRMVKMCGCETEKSFVGCMWYQWPSSRTTRSLCQQWEEKEKAGRRTKGGLNFRGISLLDQCVEDDDALALQWNRVSLIGISSSSDGGHAPKEGRRNTHLNVMTAKSSRPHTDA